MAPEVETTTTDSAPEAPKDAALEAALDALPRDVPGLEPRDAAADDAWLAANDPAEGETVEPLPAPEPLEKPAAEEPAPAEVEPEKAPAPEDKDAAEKAIKALKLDGWDAKDIDSLDADALLRMGEKAGGRVKKRQEALDERAERIKELEAKVQATEDGGVHSAEPTAALDLDKVLEPHVAAISEEFGEDLGKHVKAALTAVAEAVKPPTEVPEQRTAQFRVAMELALERGRERLSRTYTGLDMEDPDVFGPISERTESLVKTGDYRGISGLYEAMQHAARIEYGDPKPKEDPEVAASVSRAKELGQPTTRSSKQPARAMTEDERESAALLALEAGGSVEEARKAYGST
jgi:hypothetical protein